MKANLFVRHLALSSAMLAASCLSPVTFAHHSDSRFDRSNPAALSGTVKEFKWGNPHSWIYLMVPTDTGGTEEWSLEGSAVNTLLRTGWTVNTLKPGQKVTILIAPMKEGGRGGAVLRLIDIDGVSFHPASDTK